MSRLTLDERLAMTDATQTSQRWRFWGTCAWGLAAFVVFFVTQFVAIAVLAARLGIDSATPPEAIRALESNAIVVSTTTFASLPAVLLVLALAIRLARRRFDDYLALKPVGVRAIVFALACTFGYGAAAGVLTYAVGRPMSVPFVADLYRTALETGTMPLVLLAVAVAAPITEESLFRGFLLRGWASSWLGSVGAVVLTSGIWACIHMQYDWVVVGEIFGLGLLFGYLRLRSGSIFPPMVAHGAYGVAAMVQAAIIAS